MKRPSEVFIGTMLGFTVGLFLVSGMDTEAGIATWLVLFPGMGACLGTLVHILRHRHR